jgi:hypothetical protein
MPLIPRDKGQKIKKQTANLTERELCLKRRIGACFKRFLKAFTFLEAFIRFWEVLIYTMTEED